MNERHFMEGYKKYGGHKNNDAPACEFERVDMARL
jgi:hypothetical protein